MRRNPVVGFALVALSMTYIASAGSEQNYVVLESCSFSSGKRSAVWSEGEEWLSTRDYLVANKKTFYPNYFKDNWETISSKSFTFGEVNGSKGNFYAYYSTEFANEGVIFANGACAINATNPKIYGNARIDSPQSDPFQFYGTQKESGTGITLAGKVSGADTTGLLVYSKDDYYYFAFSGDVKDYLGSIIVTSQYNKAGQPWGTDLVFKDDASHFGGSIEMRDGTILQAQTSTSVKSLVLKPGASLKITAGKTLAVRESFVKEGEEPLPITVDGAPSKFNEVSGEKVYALLTIPAGTPCGIGDFKIANAGTTPFTAPFVRMEEDEGGMTKTLYAVYASVRILKDEESGFDYTSPNGFSSVYDSSCWFDEKPVHGNACYNISEVEGAYTTYFSLPYADGEQYIFPAPTMLIGNNIVLFLRAKESVVTNVVISASEKSSIYALRVADREMSLKSNFYLSGTVEVCVRNDFTIKLDGPIVGADNSNIRIKSMSNQTGSCGGKAKLSGDNSRYSGKVHITCHTRESNVRFDRSASLILTSPQELGGPRSSFAHDALKIDSFGVLDVRETMKLEEPTRGIFAADIARINVADGKKLSISETLTVNGRLYKENAGDLELGGELKFVDSAGALTDAIPADATNRTFYVTGGKLKVLAADSLNGLDVVFSNLTSRLETALALDVKPQEKKLRALGICNTKSPQPFSVVDAGGSAKIKVFLECGDEVPEKEYEFGIMTVRAESESVLDSLKVVKPPQLSQYALALEKDVDDVARTVTLKAKLCYPLTIFVR